MKDTDSTEKVQGRATKQIKQSRSRPNPDRQRRQEGADMSYEHWWLIQCCRYFAASRLNFSYENAYRPNQHFRYRQHRSDRGDMMEVFQHARPYLWCWCFWRNVRTIEKCDNRWTFAL